MLQNIPKDKRQAIVICVVLAIIVIVNTVVLIFVGFKILDMEDLELDSYNNEKNELDKPRDLNLLKKEFSELEKSANENEPENKNQSIDSQPINSNDTKSNTINNNPIK